MSNDHDDDGIWRDPDDLLEKYITGDSEAGRIVFERYYQDLKTKVRLVMRSAYFRRQAGGTSDLAQSILKSLMKVTPSDRQHDSMMGLLAVITRRKCATKIAFLTAQKRDRTREREIGEEALAFPSTTATGVELGYVLELRGRLKAYSPEHFQCLEMQIAGVPYKEIAQVLGISDRSLYRLRVDLMLAIPLYGSTCPADDCTAGIDLDQESCDACGEPFPGRALELARGLVSVEPLDLSDPERDAD